MDITEANGLVGAYETKRRAVGLLALFEGTAWGEKFTIQAVKPEAGKQVWQIQRQDGERFPSLLTQRCSIRTTG